MSFKDSARCEARAWQSGSEVCCLRGSLAFLFQLLALSLPRFELLAFSQGAALWNVLDYSEAEGAAGLQKGLVLGSHDPFGSWQHFSQAPGLS